MKNLLTVLFIVFCPLSVIADNTVVIKTNSPTTSLKNELISLHAKLDSMNIANAHKVDSLNKIINTKYRAACDEFRGHCTDYYDRLDNEMSRTMTKFSIIWGIIGAFFGIVMPLILNRIAERRFRDDIDELRANVRHELVSQNRVIASRLREQYKDIGSQIKNQNKIFEKRFSEHKAYIDGISLKFQDYVKQSKINSLLSEAQALQNIDSNKAISNYTEILLIDPQNEQALLGRGITYELIKKSKEALCDLNQLVNINPRHARAFNNIGNVYLTDGLYDCALENYNKALQIDSQYASVYHNIGLMHERQNKLEEALNNYNKAIAIDDSSIKTYKCRLRLYKHMQSTAIGKEKEKYNALISEDIKKINELKDKGNN